MHENHVYKICLIPKGNRNQSALVSLHNINDFWLVCNILQYVCNIISQDLQDFGEHNSHIYRTDCNFHASLSFIFAFQITFLIALSSLLVYYAWLIKCCVFLPTNKHIKIANNFRKCKKTKLLTDLCQMKICCLLFCFFIYQLIIIGFMKGGADLTSFFWHKVFYSVMETSHFMFLMPHWSINKRHWNQVKH